MNALTIAILVFGLWTAAVFVGWRIVIPLLSRGPGRHPITGLLWITARVLCRKVHHARFSGRELVPTANEPGGLIVVSNHTGQIDPLLIQSACRFQIRWMMASDMMFRPLGWLWDHLDLIPVDRDREDPSSLRTAIRHVRSGGVLGIFPEGRIVTPPREVRPWHEGVGFIASRTGAPVLLVWVSDTPDTNQMMESVLSPSHARVQFIDVLNFQGERDSTAVTQTLRRRLAEVSGWPLNDEEMPPIINNGAPDPFAP